MAAAKSGAFYLCALSLADLSTRALAPLGSKSIGRKSIALAGVASGAWRSLYGTLASGQAVRANAQSDQRQASTVTLFAREEFGQIERQC